MDSTRWNGRNGPVASKPREVDRIDRKLLAQCRDIARPPHGRSKQAVDQKKRWSRSSVRPNQPFVVPCMGSQTGSLAFGDVLFPDDNATLERNGFTFRARIVDDQLVVHEPPDDVRKFIRMGEVVGVGGPVKTDEADEIVFARVLEARFPRKPGDHVRPG